MIKIGQKVIFDPLQYGVCCMPSYIPEYVVGEIIKIYPKHRWFLVEYPQCDQTKTLKMGFKFNDFGFRGRHRHSIVIPINNKQDELEMKDYVYHGDLDKFYITMKGQNNR